MSIEGRPSKKLHSGIPANRLPNNGAVPTGASTQPPRPEFPYRCILVVKSKLSAAGRTDVETPRTVDHLERAHWAKFVVHLLQLFL